MLFQSGCPEDLLEHYLKFLQTGGRRYNNQRRGEYDVPKGRTISEKKK